MQRIGRRNGEEDDGQEEGREDALGSPPFPGEGGACHPPFTQMRCCRPLPGASSEAEGAGNSTVVAHLTQLHDEGGDKVMAKKTAKKAATKKAGKKR